MKRMLIVAFVVAVAPFAVAETVAQPRSRAVHAPNTSKIKVALGVDSGDVVLSGYMLRVDFDPAAVEYVSVAAGTDPLFNTDPFATDAKKANADGHVKVIGVQTNHNAPVGEVSVATATFIEKLPDGAATIKVHLEQAATTSREGKVTAIRVAEEK